MGCAESNLGSGFGAVQAHQSWCFWAATRLRDV